MAFWSEQHVMQLDKRLLKLARQLWLIVLSRSAVPQNILNGPGNIKCLFLSSEHVLSLKSKCRCSFDGFILSFDSTEEQTTHTGCSSLQFLRAAYVYVVFWTFLIFGRGKKCFRRNHLADPLQYLHGPPGGRGPPVEDLCIKEQNH